MSFIRVLCCDYLCRCFWSRSTLEKLLAKHQSITFNQYHEFNHQKIEMINDKEFSPLTPETSARTKSDDDTLNESESLGIIDENNEKQKEYFTDSKYIRESEKGILAMTKPKITQLIENEINDMENYEMFFNKNNMILSMKKSGGLLSPNFPMIKMMYYIKKVEFSEGISLKRLDECMNDPIKRIKWDTSLKVIKKIEGDNEAYVLHTVLNKPVFFIAERDTIDKRLDYYLNNCFYCFSSSVNDDFLPLESGVTRVTNLFSGYKIYEDSEAFNFISVTQGDMKMNVPQSVYNYTIPVKLKEWYDLLRKEVNRELNLSNSKKEQIKENHQNSIREEDRVRLNDEGNNEHLQSV